MDFKNVDTAFMKMDILKNLTVALSVLLLNFYLVETNRTGDIIQLLSNKMFLWTIAFTTAGFVAFHALIYPAVRKSKLME